VQQIGTHFGLHYSGFNRIISQLRRGRAKGKV
jgi:hypothetical protein